MGNVVATYGFLLVSMLLGATLGLSVYLPLMAGQLSLASPAFYALGGYLAAILSTKGLTASPEYSVGALLLEMGLAAIAAAVLAFLVGYPVLRLRGIYLAIATIALVEIVRVVALNLSITGGAVGIFGIPQPFSSAVGYLWIALPLLLIAVAACWRLQQVRTGLVLAAIREDELAASAIAVNTTRYKVLAFVLGAVLASLVGAVSAHFLNTWNPRQGTFDASITFLAFVLIGGSRSAFGPVLGGMVLTALPELLRAIGSVPGLWPGLSRLLQDGRLLIFGLLLVLGSIYFPQGLIKPRASQPRRRRTS
ncbi:branched-chain amino acid ABC transporter permease [Synechococcus elongatus]|uniref:Branched-chain amino acid ABC transporter, permease protein n=2 Tax=Synechococcus elongatus TaxID=32046 RepID=Q8GIU1_SYNE7|nr:branched-chain amino acid ABC transporter permease [Synechococcus elongatus]AAN71769.1 unknown [Synechococcus elongatus PCC 7942 = FACHB-805]ABB58524.1 putative branched-chain amino acid ABC transporter, permease protein [Synechococcus elongatus PCC 7942 = FACHB-805]AJD57022.1 branched-chain amino acid ABC transporter permease [Synechococcus elongatus UTEX 2973]MBD2587243.1 branched-chain amino acid ABC transporter permease [Synechococcus elongatus FACHB-242]MBD2688312.1 branched-chain amin